MVFLNSAVLLWVLHGVTIVDLVNCVKSKRQTITIQIISSDQPLRLVLMCFTKWCIQSILTGAGMLQGGALERVERREGNHEHHLWKKHPLWINSVCFFEWWVISENSRICQLVQSNPRLRQVRSSLTLLEKTMYSTSAVSTPKLAVSSSSTTVP